MPFLHDVGAKQLRKLLSYGSSAILGTLYNSNGAKETIVNGLRFRLFFQKSCFDTTKMSEIPALHAFLYSLGKP